MTRITGIFLLLFLPLWAHTQGGDQQLRAKADGLFNERRYAEAAPLYSQLVSLSPSDRDLNYRYGTTLLFSGEDKEKAIGHLKFAVGSPAIAPDAWFWMGRAYHLNYRFKDALSAYQHYRGVADKKTLVDLPAEALEQQCRNGLKLLSKLKDITVRSKVEVAQAEFFRFYDLSDIGGRIVVMPDELKSPLDKKNKLRSLVYLPDKGGAIYFSSYGKDGKTGLDIYRTELMPDGRFATPVKLAGFINTELDDDYAFMHPDGRSFFFSSKGHTSMGGYDVFRATYDSGMDAFGRPENLDFAVNTPDDDIFYLVDAEQKEACFASGRSSKQDKLHVYRVSTAQVPLVITVLKGTYASEFDANDRKAKITVIDALTQEQVAEVRTDINGSYVLSLPRSGKFRFMVECGPTGKTHSGQVDVPRSEGPKAYRQELSLTKQGDLERLVIRNYFEEPLEDDLIALALDEILRRARLDVTGEAAVVAQTPAPEGPVDVLTQAGFPGTIDRADVPAIAEADARDLAEQAEEFTAVSNAAFAIAIEAVAEAERSAREAEELVAKATTQDNEEQRNATMVEAARMRQRSREADLRAQAAYRTGRETEREALNIRQQAATAERLATDIRTTLAAGRDKEALPYLTMLKERLDAKSGPTARMDIAERTRAALTAQEKEAASALTQANAKRAEERELTDRVARLRRELQETRSNSRKDELTREITEYEVQLEHLRKDADKAFAKAGVMERETAVARGGLGLTKHLTTPGKERPTTEASTDQVAALEQRISGARSRIERLVIDERYDAQLALRSTDMEARSFAWDLTASEIASSDRMATRAADRSTEQDAQRAAARNTEVQAGKVGERGLGEAEVAEGGVQRGMETDPIGSQDAAAGKAGTVGESTTTSRTGTEESSASASGADTNDGVSEQRTASRDATTNSRAVNDPSNVPTSDARSASVGTSTNSVDDGRGNDVDREDVASSEKVGEDASSEAIAQQERQGPGSTKADEGGEDTANTSGTNDVAGLTPEQVRNAEVGRTETEVASSEPKASEVPDTFMLENEIAELRQQASTERDRTKRSEIETRIRTLDAQLMEREAEILASQTAAAGADAGSEEEVSTATREAIDPSRMPLVFDPSVADARLIKDIFADHGSDEAQLKTLTDADERAAALHGLELMLADSIRAEMDRQVAVLELAPQQADRVLPRVERLRKLREERLALADAYLEERQAQLLASGESVIPTPEGAGEDTASGTTTSTLLPAGSMGPDPTADRFVAIAADPREIYSSKVEHRSEEVAEAVVAQDAALASIEELSRRIDSLYVEYTEMSSGKERDRKLKAMDRLKDERLIARTDLGQRSAFISKEEWSTASDSLKGLEKDLVRKGLPATEPLLVMQRGMQAEAEDHMQQAAKHRKTADRSEDIFVRDSLYRQAYELELRGLREMDRSLTVTNYLLSERHVRGETIPYATLASRLFGTESDAAILAERTAPAPTITMRVPEGTAESTDRTAEGINSQDVAVARSTERAATTASGSEDAPRPESAVPDITDNTPSELGEVASIDQARSDAQELLSREEAVLDEKARRPAQLYERYLNSEDGVGALSVEPQQADGSVLSLKAAQFAQDAVEVRAMEQQAIDLADQATALEDSAANARKRDRKTLEELAVRTRQEAEEVQRASLLKADAVRIGEQELASEREELALRRRLVKFYYLSGEEQDLVIENDDRSRYFQARTRAMEQSDAAAEATEGAKTNRELGLALQQRSTAMLSGGNTNDAADRTEGARMLQQRASSLIARADSLDDVARRLRGAASVNDGQAALMLQAMPDEQATSIMALEMGARRTEPLLAEARGQAGTQGGDPVGTPQAQGIASEGLLTITMPEELVEDIFELKPRGERSASAIMMDAPMPDGLVFKVQIGAFRSAVPEQTFSDMTPVMGESVGNGLVRYTAGLFTSFDQAAGAKDKVRDRGYRDAFVVAYRNGQRIPLGEAMREARAAQAIAGVGTTTQQSSAEVDTQRATGTEAAQEQSRPATGQDASTRTQVVQAVPGDSQTATPPSSTTEPVTATIERPSVLADPTPTPEEEVAAILAKYPESATAIVERFVPAPEAASYYNVPGAAPARQVETIKGLFFTVQVGVYSKPVALDKLFNITPLNSELTESGKIRYTTGLFLDTEQARVRKDGTVQLGVKDAFVTAYLNGKRIPMREANALLERFGPEILARP
jgi:hypothetical protein